MSSIADAVMEALGLQIQALLAERKAVALALGCDANETVLDAATRVAGELTNTEKQIDDVRDILKAKVGELTVDAATHAIVLAQNHATMVKQVEQLTRELDEARRRLKVEREHSEASDRHLVETHQALGGRSGVEHVTEAARRVAQERDTCRARVKDLEADICKLSGERDEAKALAITLVKERDDARALCVAVAAELYALPDEPALEDLRDEVGEARQARRDRDKALAELNAVRRILLPVNDRETTVDAAKRVAKERDGLRAALQTVSHCQQATARSFLSLAETLGVSPSDAFSRVNSIIAREAEFRLAVAAYAQQDEELRDVLLAGDTERTLEAARRLANAYEDTRKESFRLRNDLENIRKMTKAGNGETANAAVWRILYVKLQHDQARELLSPRSDAETTVDAAKRVVAERDQALADASSVIATRVREALGATSDERTEDAAKRVVRERDAAQASSRRFADVVMGVSATLGAREDEDAVTAAKRVVKERHDLRDELDKRMSL